MIESLPFLNTNEWRCRWLIFPNAKVLHRVRTILWDDADQIAGRGETICGRKGHLAIPGIISRISKQRCRECCRKLGIVFGSGAPFNQGIDN